MNIGCSWAWDTWICFFFVGWWLNVAHVFVSNLPWITKRRWNWWWYMYSTKSQAQQTPKITCAKQIIDTNDGRLTTMTTLQQQSNLCKNTSSTGNTSTLNTHRLNYQLIWHSISCRLPNQQSECFGHIKRPLAWTSKGKIHIVNK